MEAKKPMESNNVKYKNWDHKQLHPPIFPGRLRNQKLDRQFNKVLDVFNQLYINILLIGALESMPTYDNFLKEILSNKRR